MPDTYIKFDGVDGEAQQLGADKYIELISFSLSAFAPESADAGGGSGVGKPTYTPVSMTSIAGAHTPMILKKFNEGKHFNNVEVVYLKQTGAGPAEWYRKITLKNVFVTGYSDSKVTDSLANESITLKFEEIKQEYKKQESDGSLVAAGDNTYNNKTNMSS